MSPLGPEARDPVVEDEKPIQDTGKETPTPWWITCPVVFTLGWLMLEGIARIFGVQASLYVAVALGGWAAGVLMERSVKAKP